jgi:hypothetical protein
MPPTLQRFNADADHDGSFPFVDVAWKGIRRGELVLIHEYSLGCGYERAALLDHRYPEVFQNPLHIRCTVL